MLDAILSIIPIFALIIAGYIFGHNFQEKLQAYKYFNNYLIWLGIPSMVFYYLARAPFETLFDLPFIAVMIGCQLLIMSFTMFFASNFFSTPFGERSLHVMNANFSNFLLIGIPLMAVTFSEQGLLSAIVYAVVVSLLVIPLVNGMLYYDRILRMALDKKFFKPLFIGLLENFKNPIIFTFTLAIILSYFEIILPTPVSKTFELFSNTTQPIGLFTVGLFTAEMKVTHNWKDFKKLLKKIPFESWWVVTVKLFFYPIITWFVVTLLVPLDPLYQATMVIMAAIPSSNYVYYMAEKYNIRKNDTKLEIFLTTIFSLLPLTIVVSYYLYEV